MSSAAPPVISNRAARRLLLASQGLSDDPTRRLDDAGLLDLIERMGFVQIDSIRTVERAHHHILFSRNQNYRREQLVRLIDGEASLFENWTHDAAIIPSRFYPFWRRRFERERERLAERWRNWGRDGFEAYLSHVLERIGREGPLMARDFGEERKKGSGGWWDWHPEKTALEYLWRTGALAVARREGFQKVYDLPEHVIPREHLDGLPSRGAFIDWKCRSALARLCFATPGELAAFWGTLSPAEAKAWCDREMGRAVTRVLVEPADGSKCRPSFALSDILGRLEDPPAPPPRIRALNPFDPLIRDRARLRRLFGFRYRIEVFVPAAKRQYGYYVFPLLEGGRLVGRIDMKADRAADTLAIAALWMEPKCRLTPPRRRRLEAELDRVRRFARVGGLRFADGWLKRDGDQGKPGS